MKEKREEGNKWKVRKKEDWGGKDEGGTERREGRIRGR